LPPGDSSSGIEFVAMVQNFAVASGRQVSSAPRGVERMAGAHVGDQDVKTERDYEVGRGKPPVHSRFKKGQSGNPRGPRPKSLPALLVDALNETVVATIDGERREITKREAVVTQLVNKSTCADLRATKMLIDMLKDAEKKAGAAAPPEPAPFAAADEEVMATFNTRRQSWEEELRQQGTENGGSLPER
jgi:hypothetical protein